MWSVGLVFGWSIAAYAASAPVVAMNQAVFGARNYTREPAVIMMLLALTVIMSLAAWGITKAALVTGASHNIWLALLAGALPVDALAVFTSLGPQNSLSILAAAVFIALPPAVAFAVCFRSVAQDAGIPDDGQADSRHLD